MKLRINSALRTMLQACRASIFTLTAISTVIGGTFAYNLHALSNNLEGAAGTYTLTELDGTKKLSNGSETVDYTGTVFFQGTRTGGIHGNMTVNVESGTHHVTYLSAGGASFDVATEANPVNLAINVSGSSNITFGSNSLLYGWSGAVAGITTNAYVNSNINVDTTGTVSSLILTIEANSSSNANRKFYGNQNVTYTAGHVAVNPTDSGFSTVSLAAGAKAAQIVGNINYTFGEIGADNDALTFAGTIYAGIVKKDSGGGKVTGDTNITINSGTFTSVFGAGEEGSSHVGSVTINYNGGIIGNQISATAGASISEVATLNVGGALNSSKVAMSTFDVINTTSAAGNLIVDNAVTIGADQTLSLGADSAVTVNSSLTLNGELDLGGGSLTIGSGGSLSFGADVLIDLSTIGGATSELNYTIFTGGISSSFTSLDWSNLTGLTGINQSTHNFSFSDTGILTFTIANSWTNSAGSDNLTWEVNAESTGDATDTFANGDNVIFSATTTANVSGNIEANNVAIADSATLTLGLAEAGATLEAGSFTVGAGSTLDISADVLTANSTGFTGGASSNIIFATGENIAAGYDFSGFAGSLTVESGTLTSANKERFDNLSSLNLAANTTLHLTEILSNADHHQLNNVTGDDSTVLSVAFVGQTGDSHNNNNGRIHLSNEFTGTIEVREGRLNLAYSGLGGAKTIIIGNSGSGSNSGLYLNTGGSGSFGASLTVEVKAGTTGYLAQDNGNHVIASSFVGGTDTILRKNDVNNLTVSGDMSGFLGKLQAGQNTFTVTSSSATNISGLGITGGATFVVGDGGQVRTPELLVESGTGTLNVLSGGTLSLTNGLSVAANTLTLNVNNGSTLNLGNTAASGAGTINANIAGGATVNATAATTNVLNNLALTGSGNVTLSASEANATVTVSAAISGAAGLAIQGQAGQTFVLSGNNTYEGGTNIAANTKVSAASLDTSLGRGSVNFVDASSELTVGNNLTIRGKDSSSSLSYNADRTTSTYTNLSLTTTGSTSREISNSTLINTEVTLGGGSTLTLTNVVIDENSRISNTDATLQIADSTIRASVDAGSLVKSSNTAKTTEAISSDIELIYSLTNIDVKTVELSGSLTLVVDLAGGLDWATEFQEKFSKGPVGFELANISAYNGYYGDVDIRVMDGAAILYDGVALGATTSSENFVVFYIPEPSTVTMSLLALAGLVARRRRKAISC